MRPVGSPLLSLMILPFGGCGVSRPIPSSLERDGIEDGCVPVVRHGGVPGRRLIEFVPIGIASLGQPRRVDLRHEDHAVRRRHVGQIADVRQDVRDGIHDRHRTILLAQRGRDWMRVAVLQARQNGPPGEVYFARRRARRVFGRRRCCRQRRNGRRESRPPRPPGDRTTSSRCGRCSRWCRVRVAAPGSAREAPQRGARR